MDERQIYIILHGEKIANIPNPGLTEKGINQIERVADSCVLPKNPSVVICGTGARHSATARVVGLTPTAYNQMCGCPDSSDISDGKKVVLLADGINIPIDKCMIPDTKPFIQSLENNTILIAGRPLMLGFGFRKAKEGSVIKITVSVSSKRSRGWRDQTIYNTNTDIKIILDSGGQKDIH